MKRVGKELRKPVPKRDDRIFKRYPFRINIAFRTEMIDILFSVVMNNPGLYTVPTVIDLTVRANPLGRLGGMVMARCPHKTPSNCTFSFYDPGFIYRRSSANMKCVHKRDVSYYYIMVLPIHQTQSSP